MGAVMKKLAVLISIMLLFSSTSALAATKSPKPTPKATANASAQATVKATAKATSGATTKPKPKPKPKPKKRKKIKLTPSPKPKWPPVGFANQDGVYAKVPSKKELVGVISAKKNLASQVEACTKYVCGAVQVASEPGCIWWEVNSRVFAPDKTAIGTLQTIADSSKSREIKTILLISPEPLETQEYVSNVEVVCHQEAKPADYPSVTFTKVDR
jgi:hypothetical protein